jgi:hypothetical protein
VAGVRATQGPARPPIGDDLSGDGPSATDTIGETPDEHHAGTVSSRPDQRRLWLGRGIVVAAVAVITAVVLAADVGLTSDALAGQWQLVDIRVLADAPLQSVWHLHTQPPAYNLLVGLVAWSPLPLAGTVFAVSIAAILGIGLLLHGLLVRWGAGPVAAGAVVAVSLLNPCLLSALHWGHYEILVGFTLVAALVAAHRYLEDPRPGTLLLVTSMITLCGLIRSLFHPLWVIAAIAVLVAIRPLPRRYAALALVIPTVIFGGWMAKNLILVDSATTSSWLGFNLQRGIVASMSRDDVRAAVADGRVSPLALETPWEQLERYEPWTGSCEPGGHPATDRPDKDLGDGQRAPNFNSVCYLPVYRQAQEDAFQLVRDHPGRYLSTRGAGLVTAFQPAQVGVPPDETVIDRVYRPFLLVTQVRISQDDWNLPLFGADHIDQDVSVTLLLASLAVAVRAAIAARRLARVGLARRHEWPAGDVIWLLVAATVAMVVVGGSLLEFGENGRFRSSLDPLLIALPLGWGVTALPRWWRQRTAGDTV